MTRPRPLAARLRAQDGVSLVEQLIVMAVSLVVLFAVLDTAENFTSSSAANTRLTDAEDRMRTEMATLATDLRQAPPINASAAAGEITPIAIARPHDVIFRDPDVASGWIRYCTGPSTSVPGQRALRRGEMTGGFSDPGTDCPAGTSGGWTYGDVLPEGVREEESLFAYTGCASASSCAATNVETVMVTIAIEHVEGRTLRLTSAVTPRNLG